MSDDARMFEDLAERVPALRGVYEAHVFNENGVLPHVLMADVAREVMSAYQGDADADPDLDWRAVLAVLEENLVGGDPETAAVIVTSFLEYLPLPGEPGAQVADELGPVMAERLTAYRTGGQ